MVRKRWVHIVCCMMMFIIQIGHTEGQTNQENPDGASAATSSTSGRSNPFASILQQDTVPVDVDMGPLDKMEPVAKDLFSESIQLQYLNAQNASDAFACLSSPQGKIVAQEGDNTLIVFDTPETLKRIVTEIRKADRPVQGLTVRAVVLKEINANIAAAVLAKLGSGAGTMVVDEKSNTLIICDTQNHVAGIVAELEKIDVPMNNLVVETVNLRFLEAANLAAVLNKMVTPYGSISTNQASNSVIICDTEDNVKRILQEVNRADKTPSQIMIEVVLLDVKLDNDTEIGINWDLLSENLYDVSFRQSFSGTGGRLWMVPNDTTAFDGEFYNATRYNTQGEGGDFSLISGTIRHVLHMLQEKKDVEIVASPRALVVSGRTARIKAVEEIPYTETSDTSNGGQLTSTKFKDVGVTLEVTPTLTDQNEIFLSVNTEHNVQTGESTDGIPIVDTRSETTFLLIKDGQMVVMGGLRRQEKTMQVQQIPLLGDLPIVGFLFRKTHDVMKNTELVVLLAPHIYRGEPVPADIMNSVDTIRKGALRHPTTNEAPVKSKAKRG